MVPIIEFSKPLTLAGRNGVFRIGPDPAIKDVWVKLMEDFGRIEGQVGLRTYGVCHNFDGDMMEYLAAVQVSNAGQVPGYLHTMIIPRRKVAIFRHEGKLETLSETWAWIFDTWLPEANLAVAGGPQFETYSDDFDSDAGTGCVEVHIPVK
jgi:AraC family transcriptional regulator